jgi:hypothetical protein
MCDPPPCDRQSRKDGLPPARPTTAFSALTILLDDAIIRSAVLPAAANRCASPPAPSISIFPNVSSPGQGIDGDGNRAPAARRLLGDTDLLEGPAIDRDAHHRAVTRFLIELGHKIGLVVFRPLQQADETRRGQVLLIDQAKLG